MHNICVYCEQVFLYILYLKSFLNSFFERKKEFSSLPFRDSHSIIDKTFSAAAREMTIYFSTAKKRALCCTQVYWHSMAKFLSSLFYISFTRRCKIFLTDVMFGRQEHSQDCTTGSPWCRHCTVTLEKPAQVQQQTSAIKTN